jgi:hypothetical protein
MKKLDLDTLLVDTFATTFQPAAARGTVLGNAAINSTGCPVSYGGTCVITCTGCVTNVC